VIGRAEVKRRIGRGSCLEMEEREGSGVVRRGWGEYGGEVGGKEGGNTRDCVTML